ncbi:MAG TPA: GTPase Era [Gammaproteobacteria bacterium]|nr:GTPase Era [Gammaproteobacteria bacterium]
MTSNAFRVGTVAILGRPNVGKSTLLNHLIGQKLAIVSRKPQTTRQPLLGVVHRADAQIGFIDTPGLEQRNRRPLARAVNREALRCLEDVDVAVLLVEALRVGPEDLAIAEQIRRSGKPWLIAASKLDRVKDKSRLLPFLAELGERYPDIEIVPLSAHSGSNLTAFVEVLVGLLPLGEPLWEDDALTDRSLRFLAAEFIREKLIRRLGEELPYALAVTIDLFQEEANQTRIAATIWVEREGQKAIVIGEKGTVLKAVGMEARRDLERLLERPIFLETWVKVREGWTEDTRALRELGFDH